MSETLLKRVCVFLGAKSGAHPLYRQQARQLGRLLAQQGCELIYGGGNVGLMGEVADACLMAEGKVTGIIPKSLVGLEIEGRPVAHHGVSQLEIVDSMHQRKARMAELADAFIALPGGYGTLEELFEVTTWAQLGFHAKPIGLLNVNGFYDHVLQHLNHLVQEGFLGKNQLALLWVSDSPETLLSHLDNQLRLTPAPALGLSDPEAL